MNPSIEVADKVPECSKVPAKKGGCGEIAMVSRPHEIKMQYNIFSTKELPVNRENKPINIKKAINYRKTRFYIKSKTMDFLDYTLGNRCT